MIVKSTKRNDRLFVLTGLVQRHGFVILLLRLDHLGPYEKRGHGCYDKERNDQAGRFLFLPALFFGDAVFFRFPLSFLLRFQTLRFPLGLYFADSLSAGIGLLVRILPAGNRFKQLGRLCQFIYRVLLHPGPGLGIDTVLSSDLAGFALGRRVPVVGDAVEKALGVGIFLLLHPSEGLLIYAFLARLLGLLNASFALGRRILIVRDAVEKALSVSVFLLLHPLKGLLINALLARVLVPVVDTGHGPGQLLFQGVVPEAQGLLIVVQAIEGLSASLQFLSF